MSNQPSGGVHSQHIDKLIEDSSLGTTGARRLRNRTPASKAAVAQRLAALRNAAAHGELADVLELGELCEQLGAHEEAKDCYRRAAAATLTRLAALLELDGETDAANQWNARAKTIHPGTEV